MMMERPPNEKIATPDTTSSNTVVLVSPATQTVNTSSNTSTLSSISLPSSHSVRPDNPQTPVRFVYTFPSTKAKPQLNPLSQVSQSVGQKPQGQVKLPENISQNRVFKNCVNVKPLDMCSAGRKESTVLLTNSPQVAASPVKYYVIPANQTKVPTSDSINIAVKGQSLLNPPGSRPISPGVYVGSYKLPPSPSSIATAVKMCGTKSPNIVTINQPINNILNPGSQYVVVHRPPKVPVLPKATLPVSNLQPSPTTLKSVSSSFRPVILHSTQPVTSNDQLQYTFIQSPMKPPNQGNAPIQFVPSPYPVESSQTNLEEVHFLPEACAEVVVESSSPSVSDNCPVPSVSAEPYIDTPADDVCEMDGTPGSDEESKDPSDSGRRKRKKPKRLITEDADVPTKTTPSKKKFLKPVVFDPCFVVIERLNFLSEEDKLKRSVQVNTEHFKDGQCLKICKESFLHELCRNKSIPCNRALSSPVQANIQHKTDSGAKPVKLTLVFDNKGKKNNNKDGLYNARRKRKVSQHKIRSVLLGDNSFDGAHDNDVKTTTGDGGADVPSAGAATKRDNGECESRHENGNITCLNTSPSHCADSSELSNNEKDSSFPDENVESSGTSSRKHENAYPSSETDSAITESYLASDAESSPEKPGSISDKQHQEVSTCSRDDLDYQGSPLQSQVALDTEETNPDETIPENDEGKPGDACKPAVEEESDDDWGMGELEVDPDSESEALPEEASPEKVSTTPSAVLQTPALEPAECDVPEQETVRPLPCGGPVLSEKVQRLKAMLEEQTKQLESLRKSRKRSK